MTFSAETNYHFSSLLSAIRFKRRTWLPSSSPAGARSKRAANILLRIRFMRWQIIVGHLYVICCHFQAGRVFEGASLNPLWYRDTPLNSQLMNFSGKSTIFWTAEIYLSVDYQVVSILYSPIFSACTFFCRIELRML